MTARPPSRGCRDTARRCVSPRSACRPDRGSAPGEAACTARGECRAPPSRRDRTRDCFRADPRRPAPDRSRRPPPGILRLVSKLLPGRVTRPRPRASLNSSSFSAFASMMKPRSAPVTSMAESITSASTSSSTRPDPRARRPSSSAAICRRSPTAEVVCWSTEPETAASSRRKTISAPPLRPSRIRSPCASVFSVTCSLLTKVPYREPRSRSVYVVALERDLRVVAGDIAADQLQVVAAATTDGKHRLLEGHHAPPERIRHFETSDRHGR